MLSAKELKITGIVYFSLLALLLYLMRHLLPPLAFALLFALLLDPLVDRVSRVTRFRSVAIGLSVGFVLLISTLVSLAFLPLIARDVTSFTERLPELLQWIQNSAIPSLERWFEIEIPTSIAELTPQIQAYLSGWTASEIGSVGGVLAALFSMGYGAFGLFLNLFLIPFFTFYLLKDYDHYREQLPSYFPVRMQSDIKWILTRLDLTLSGFVRGQLAVGFFLSVIFIAGLTLIKLPFSFAIGLLAGFASLIPYLGAVLGILLAVSAAIISLSGLWTYLGILILFVVAQLMESFLLTPYFVGQKVGLPPILVIIAVIAGGELGGVSGIILAIPIAATIKIFGEFWLTELQRGDRNGGTCS